MTDRKVTLCPLANISRILSGNTTVVECEMSCTSRYTEVAGLRSYSYLGCSREEDTNDCKNDDHLYEKCEVCSDDRGKPCNSPIPFGDITQTVVSIRDMIQPLMLRGQLISS